MRIKKIEQNTRDFNITDAIVDGGTDLNEATFNQMQDNMEEAIDGIIETGSDGKGNYHTKFADGTLICRGTTSVVTGIQGNSGSYVDVSFSSSFLNTTYTVLTGKTDSGAYWANIDVHPSYRTTTGFRMNYYNTSDNSTTSGNMYFTYIAIGKWK